MVTGALFIAAAALLFEALFGYPQALYRAIGHPVTWIGALISLLDKALYRPAWSFALRRAMGILALLLLLGITGGLTLFAEQYLIQSQEGVVLAILLAATLPAQRSLNDHVVAVANALDNGGVEAGRKSVSMIVGRNTSVLDEAGVSRAAIESLAENFSDGVVAPIFWTAMFSLTGGVLYKAANTADSMIGHKTEKYSAFGWASARFDDLINLPASRISAVLIILAAALIPGCSAWNAIKAVRRDAKHHRSPNAGWPEAAMAGALDLKIAGPRIYGSEIVMDAYMGNGRSNATAEDIRRALMVYRVAAVIEGLVVVGLGLAAGM
jgi:adenosylcobinamide-phosphate synthase